MRDNLVYDDIPDGDGQKRGRPPADGACGHETGGPGEPFPIAVGVGLVAHQADEDHLGDELRRQHPRDAEHDRQRQSQIVVPKYVLGQNLWENIRLPERKQIGADPDERAINEPRHGPESEVRE